MHNLSDITAFIWDVTDIADPIHLNERIILTLSYSASDILDGTGYDLMYRSHSKEIAISFHSATRYEINLKHLLMSYLREIAEANTDHSVLVWISQVEWNC